MCPHTTIYVSGDIEDTGGDIDETAHVAALESIFGEGVCAEGWLKGAKFNCFTSTKVQILTPDRVCAQKAG